MSFAKQELLYMFKTFFENKLKELLHPSSKCKGVTNETKQKIKEAISKTNKD